ncbi:hypothetical protein [Microbacterium sp.]|uniref:hypothetical protein n=1 Tax=Microbacterium sp. TaxID=51671 RepID=UPI003F9DC8B0
MSSEATTSFHTPADVATVAAAIQRVLAENKHKVLGQSPDGSQIDFQTKKTLLNWELIGRAVTVPGEAGSDVHLSLDLHHNRPPAALDGVKNRKALEKLTGQIQSALG